MRGLNTTLIVAGLASCVFGLSACGELRNPGPICTACTPAGGAGFPSVVNPYVKTSGDTFERSVFSATSPDSIAVDVRSIYVSARGHGRFTDLGPGLLEVISGSATVTIEGMIVDAGEAKLIPFSARQPISFDNLGDQPLVVRLYLFGVR